MELFFAHYYYLQLSIYLLLYSLFFSVGKVKNIAITAFDVPIEYKVYQQPDSSGSPLVLLSKAVYNSLVDNDCIHLALPTTTAVASDEV